VSQTPPPVQINHPLLFSICTALWGVALIVMVILEAAGIYPVRVWIVVCVVGFLLGILAIIYSKSSWRTRLNPDRPDGSEPAGE
jgi:hypothetical protein